MLSSGAPGAGHHKYFIPERINKMKMSKRIVSLVITVIMLLGMTALFPSAAAPSLKLVDWKRNDIFTYEFTGAGADSWVGI